VSSETPILLLPYAVALLIKLPSIFLEKRIITGVLENIASLPKPPSVIFDLNADQRNVIAAHLIHANLKTTILITFVTSFVSAVVIVFDNKGIHWMPLILPLFLAVGCVMLAWVLPSKPHSFCEPGWFGLERSSWALLLSCGYDVGLAGLALFTYLSPNAY